MPINPNVGLVTQMDPQEYSWLVRTFRSFYETRGFLEAPVQHRPSILAACEDPLTKMSYIFNGNSFPLPQTGQMWLEEMMLTMPGVPGYFCHTTSYRNEPDPIPGRHDRIFQMFEAESHGTMDDLHNELCSVLEHFGFGSRESYRVFDYNELAAYYGVESLTHVHEGMMYKEFGPIVFIRLFPEHTDPFWNMKRAGSLAKKIDVIVCGKETFGCAERSTDPEEMRHNFYAIKDGNYALSLYQDYRKDRVLTELEWYLGLDFYPHYGFGSGKNRLIAGLKELGIMPHFPIIAAPRNGRVLSVI